MALNVANEPGMGSKNTCSSPIADDNNNLPEEILGLLLAVTHLEDSDKEILQESILTTIPEGSYDGVTSQIFASVMAHYKRRAILSTLEARVISGLLERTTKNKKTSAAPDMAGRLADSLTSQQNCSPADDPQDHAVLHSATAIKSTGEELAITNKGDIAATTSEDKCASAMNKTRDLPISDGSGRCEEPHTTSSSAASSSKVESTEAPSAKALREIMPTAESRILPGFVKAQEVAEHEGRGIDAPDTSHHLQKETSCPIGATILTKMGWKRGDGLGPDGTGIKLPISVPGQVGGYKNAGLGAPWTQTEASSRNGQCTVEYFDVPKDHDDPAVRHKREHDWSDLTGAVTVEIQTVEAGNGNATRQHNAQDRRLMPNTAEKIDPGVSQKKTPRAAIGRWTDFSKNVQIHDKTFRCGNDSPITPEYILSSTKEAEKKPTHQRPMPDATAPRISNANTEASYQNVRMERQLASDQTSFDPFKLTSFEPKVTGSNGKKRANQWARPFQAKDPEILAQRYGMDISGRTSSTTDKSGDDQGWVPPARDFGRANRKGW